MRTLSVVVAGIAFASTAYAGDPPSSIKSIEVGGGLTVELASGKLAVRDGKVSAPIYAATAITAAKVDDDQHTVTMTVTEAQSANCRAHVDETYPVAALRARIDARKAELALAARDYHAAAAAATKALAALPTWQPASYDLAAARLGLKDLAGAIAALAPLLAAQPIATYVEVSTNPALEPLLARPELVAIAAKQPGTAKATYDVPLYSAQLGLVAIAEQAGVLEPCQLDTWFGIYDAATGAPRASLYLTREADYSCAADGTRTPTLRTAQAVIDARTANAVAILDRLGFSTTPTDPGPIGEPTDSGHMRSQLPASKLDVVTDGLGANSHVAISKGNTVLGSGPAFDRLGYSYLLTEPRIAVVQTYIDDGNYTCGANPRYRETVIKLK